MANFDMVTPYLATGGDISHHDDEVAAIHEIVAAGVTHVIDNRVEWSDEAAFAALAPEVTYLHNGVDDAHHDISDDWFDAGVAFATEAWGHDRGAVVLAHCHMGINRGPSMAYRLLLARGVDPVRSLAMIRGARSIAYVRFAPEALDHHHRRTGAPADRRRVERGAVLAWLDAHSFDVAAEIRRIRENECRSA